MGMARVTHGYANLCSWMLPADLSGKRASLMISESGALGSDKVTTQINHKHSCEGNDCGREVPWAGEYL